MLKEKWVMIQKLHREVEIIDFLTFRTPEGHNDLLFYKPRCLQCFIRILFIHDIFGEVVRTCVSRYTVNSCAQ